MSVRLGRAAVILAAGLALLTIGACGGDEDEGGAAGGSASEEPIVIGAAVGLTGFMEFVDKPMIESAKLAIEDVNADGGVLGRELQLEVADMKSDVSLSQPTALDLIDKGADFIFTAADYDIGGPAARVANDQGIIAFGVAGAPQFGVQGIGPYAFNAWHGNPTEGAVMATWADQQGWEKPFVFKDTTLEYTKTVCDAFDAVWKGLGKSQVPETFKNDDASIASQISRLRSSDADGIILCSYPPGGSSAIRQIRAAGIDLPIMGSGGGMDGTSWIEAVPDLSNYVNTSAGSVHGDDPDPAVNEFAERYEQAVGEPLQVPQGYMGYAMVQSVAQAIEAAGSTEADAVKAALEEFTDVELLSGQTTYTAECHVPVGRPLRVIGIDKGKFSFKEMVEPVDVPDAPC